MSERRKTDWWCRRCKRSLANEGDKCPHRDSVTLHLQGGVTHYTHDGCGGDVQSGQS